MFGLKIKNPKSLFIKILIIFVPIYLIAYFTQNMIYVLPTLAVGIVFGNNLDDGYNKDDGEEGDDGDSGDASSDASDSWKKLKLKKNYLHILLCIRKNKVG